MKKFYRHLGGTMAMQSYLLRMVKIIETKSIYQILLDNNLDYLIEIADSGKNNDPNPFKRCRDDTSE